MPKQDVTELGVLGVFNDPEGPEGWFIVAPILSKNPVGDSIRRYPSRAAAWHHAVWSRFHDGPGGTMPRLSAGNSFVPHDGDGYTTDPRFAEAIPYDDMTEGERERVRLLATRFIRANIGTMSDMEVFFMPKTERVGDSTDDAVNYDNLIGEATEQAAEQEQAQETPESAPESLTEPEGDNPPADLIQAAREAMTDVQRNAFDNFTHMMNNAPSEAASNYWYGKAKEVLQAVTA